MNTEKKLISVMVPVYNVAPSLFATYDCQAMIEEIEKNIEDGKNE